MKKPRGTQLLQGDTVCPLCDENFCNTKLFDWHRIGPVNGRRCRREDEMLAAGLAVNSRGRWHDPVATAAVAVRMAARRAGNPQDALAA